MCIKKWSFQLNWNFLLKQSSYVTSEKSSRIFIKFPLIWYIVGLCGPNFNRYFLVLNEALFSRVKIDEYTHFAVIDFLRLGVNITFNFQEVNIPANFITDQYCGRSDYYLLTQLECEESFATFDPGQENESESCYTTHRDLSRSIVLRTEHPRV